MELPTEILLSPPYQPWPKIEEVSAKLDAMRAPTCSPRGKFPQQEFALLREAGLLNISLPNQPLDFRERRTPHLLQLLKLIGKGNLCVGRIYEGHINALYLIHRFGSASQQEHMYKEVYQEQQLFGVWNTQAQDGIVIRETNDGRYVLSGSKTFCSGAAHVGRPIVTGRLIRKSGQEDGWQMCLVPLDQLDLPIDTSFWNPLGMQDSVSYKIDFTGVELKEQNLLGLPDDYHRQPCFSGGAIRFAAVHLGGAEAIYDACRKFLKDLKRTEDPYQQMRLGEIAVLIESGNLWIQQAGAKADQPLTTDQQINYANMTRMAIEKISLEVMRLSERCVGARGLLPPQPFARLHTDLTTYLRQPAPDQALAKVGEYVSKQNQPAHDHWSTQS
ncbi:alkylation response protein AidB-like acyl-CoA dehydrogenase [Catalinimonas alkaloidigena]|uniref:acyl-CoA dehydrogenase family protein n=1 Tax=Catalinimonas alkaloidigena TaxID=1075417 RepID=UPI002405696D|nr:acyl-CoA dehydrogenase family protein [Catalinimonas alkaloidigena]MDF9797081.1 alkylation response protein AidB-like acyl-CoA dehydrogenase [Catalinimonas alkaloidigena]